MSFRIHNEIKPNADDVNVLMMGIHDHNTQHSGDNEAQTLSLFLRDEKGAVVGGAYGWTAYGWLRIDVLWVREDLRGRGFGKQLLEATEAEGVRRGCQYATLDSFSFQAPELYKKYGYEEFAVLDKIGENQTWHFFKKHLRPET